MGFFSDLKEDLSQAVNELMPDEEQIKTNDEQELTEPVAETEAEASEAEDKPMFSLEEMLQNIDSINVDDTDLQLPEEAPSVEENVLTMQEKMPIEADIQPMPKEILPEAEETPPIEADIQPIPEEILSVEEEPADDFAVKSVVAESEIIESTDTADTAETNEVEVSESEMEQAEIVMNEDSQNEENKGVEESMNAMEAETMETMEAETMDTEKMEAVETMDTMDTMAGSREASDEVAVITEAMLIKGDISTEGSVDVIGTVNGNIDALGKLNITGRINGNSKAAEIYAESAKINGEVVSEGAVKIGTSSVIIGNITATSAVIAGAVKGDIDVQGPVILDTSAIVMGNIKSKSVQINNGAVIEGMCSQCYADVSPTSFFDEYKPEPARKTKSK